MSKKRKRLEDYDPLDDAALFTDDDFDVEDFLLAQDRRDAMRRGRRCKRAQRRVEALRDKRWLHDETADWDDYPD